MTGQDKNIMRGIEARRKYIGQQAGDFIITTADYDWDNHCPINLAKCVNCGYEKNISDLAAFIRGRGDARLCVCRKQKKQQKPPKKKHEEYIGEIYNGFKIIGYDSSSGSFRVECTVCGKQKGASRPSVVEGRLSCNHRPTQDYSDPKWIGCRVGNLVGVGQEGELYRFRCDCGTEVLRRPTDVFRLKGASGKTCGRTECPFHAEALRGAKNKRTLGHAFEHECAHIMKEQGYTVELTPDSGDYGVDFFAEVNEVRVAFQCKQLKVQANVTTIQEVYAGGRYFDCCKFVVVSPSGFTRPAEMMASKLGVQLAVDLNEFALSDESGDLLATNKMQTFCGTGLVWEIDGETKPAEQWCKESDITRSAVVSRMKKGMSLKDALSAPKYVRGTIEIDGVFKTKQEWCDEYGISTQLYDYRTKQGGLAPIEALTKPKMNQ